MAFNKFGKFNGIFKILLIMQVLILNAYCEYPGNEYVTKFVGNEPLMRPHGYDDYFAKENKFIDEMKWLDLLFDTRTLIRNIQFEKYVDDMKSKYYWAGNIPLGLMRPHWHGGPIILTEIENDLKTALNWTLIKPMKINGSKEFEGDYRFDYVSADGVEESWLQAWRDLTNGLLKNTDNRIEVFYFTIYC